MRSRPSLLAILLAAGCGSTAAGPLPDGPGPAGPDGATTDGLPGPDGAPADAPPADGAAGDRDPGPVRADAATDRHVPQSCAKQADCPAGMMCESRSDGNGCGSLGGKCIDLPAVCTAVSSPVCGCDGKTYDNDCVRQRAGVQRESQGACVPPTGENRCGALTCGADQLCYVPCSTCGAPPPCQPAPDGGVCPSGQVTCPLNPGGTGCQVSCSGGPAACITIPASCRDIPTCECLGALVPACAGISARRQALCLSPA
jgi:hypothetical protein